MKYLLKMSITKTKAAFPSNQTLHPKQAGLCHNCDMGGGGVVSCINITAH